MKYIIKNCPALCFPLKDKPECNNSVFNYACKDISDCLFKQIVEKCKRTLNIYKGSENEYTLGKISEAEYILKDIKIKECK